MNEWPRWDGLSIADADPTPRRKAVSMFADRNTAQEAVQAAIDAHQDRITVWLSQEADDDDLILEHRHDSDVGTVLTYREWELGAAPVATAWERLVVRRSGHPEAVNGFVVFTAYPILKKPPREGLDDPVHDSTGGAHEKTDWERIFPTLYGLFAGFLFEAWPRFYASSSEAMQDAMAHRTDAALRDAIVELEQLMGMALSERDLDDALFYGLGCHHTISDSLTCLRTSSNHSALTTRPGAATQDDLNAAPQVSPRRWRRALRPVPTPRTVRGEGRRRGTRPHRQTGGGRCRSRAPLRDRTAPGSARGDPLVPFLALPGPAQHSTHDSRATGARRSPVSAERLARPMGATPRA